MIFDRVVPLELRKNIKEMCWCMYKVEIACTDT
jgi:hypothetical protein